MSADRVNGNTSSVCFDNASERERNGPPACRCSAAFVAEDLGQEVHRVNIEMQGL